jgi:hypothetical protein
LTGQGANGPYVVGNAHRKVSRGNHRHGRVSRLRRWCRPLGRQRPPFGRRCPLLGRPSPLNCSSTQRIGRNVPTRADSRQARSRRLLRSRFRAPRSPA